MGQELLQCDKTGDSRWIITLNRPEKRNALSDDLVGALLACLADARAQDIASLVFRGEGRNLSAGFDFTDFDTVSQADLLWRFVRVQQLLSEVLSYPGLTIAVGHGRNFGAGCDLFAACKVRIATADARFRMPGVLFGLVLGTRRLGQLIGESHASRIQLSATEFDSEEALRLGFATEILKDGDGEARAAIDRLTQAVAGLAPATRHAITDVLAVKAEHEDMGRLVASVMQGDIKQRLAKYLGK